MTTVPVYVPANTDTEITALASATAGNYFFTNEGQLPVWVSRNAAMTDSREGHTVGSGDGWAFDAADDIHVWAERRTKLIVSERS